MRSLLIGCISVSIVVAFGQEKAPVPTADQIIEKSLAATGGRDALKKMTSMVGIGTLEIAAMNVTAPFHIYRKVPDKQLTVTAVEGYGDVSQGYDGKIGWKSDPQQGLVELSGEELIVARREADFYGDLRWKEHFPKAEVVGKGNVGARDCWIVKLTPTEGRPVTHYYDAETFLAAKVVSTTAEGETQTELSDYRDIGNGIKAFHTIKMTTPTAGELVIRFKEFKPNAEIDDAKFAKPQA